MSRPAASLRGWSGRRVGGEADPGPARRRCRGGRRRDRPGRARLDVLGRRIRVGRLELDLVAVDPRPPPALVIVEVRWRRSRAFGLPEETVDGRKMARLRGGGDARCGAGSWRTARRCRGCRSGWTSSPWSRADRAHSGSAITAGWGRPVAAGPCGRLRRAVGPSASSAVGPFPPARLSVVPPASVAARR